MDDDQVFVECATIGEAVLAAQRIEFLLNGLIAHVKPELKRRDKRLRQLTGETFLRGDPSALRATLGQLVEAYGIELLLSVDDLRNFVKNRNLIVHDYWRLSKDRIRGGRTLENPIAFLREFIGDCQRWEGILRGLLAHMRISAARAAGGEKQANLTIEDLDYMDQYETHVGSHLFRNRQ
ncbi:MAG: hypothetical protein OXH63_03765 [Gemmatimonadetes bacterium]|nr:hypothetical protein [Gemmatimonadota bacterium]